jgi:hypothetical protein
VLLIRDEDGKYVKQRNLHDLSACSEEELAEKWGIQELLDPIALRIDLPQIVFEEVMY